MFKVCVICKHPYHSKSVNDFAVSGSLIRDEQVPWFLILLSSIRIIQSHWGRYFKNVENYAHFNFMNYFNMVCHQNSRTPSCHRFWADCFTESKVLLKKQILLLFILTVQGPLISINLYSKMFCILSQLTSTHTTNWKLVKEASFLSTPCSNFSVVFIHGQRCRLWGQKAKVRTLCQN